MAEFDWVDPNSKPVLALKENNGWVGAAVFLSSLSPEAAVDAVAPNLNVTGESVLPVDDAAPPKTELDEPKTDFTGVAAEDDGA